MLKSILTVFNGKAPFITLATWNYKSCVRKDIDVFMDTCTVLNDTLAWDIAGNRDFIISIHRLMSAKECKKEMEKESRELKKKLDEGQK